MGQLAGASSVPRRSGHLPVAYLLGVCSYPPRFTVLPYPLLTRILRCRSQIVIESPETLCFARGAVPGHILRRILPLLAVRQ